MSSELNGELAANDSVSRDPGFIVVEHKCESQWGESCRAPYLNWPWRPQLQLYIELPDILR
jgi:hypothetical protein